MANRQISPDRQAIYYTGMIAAAIGTLMFASVFFTFMAHFGDFSNFDENAKSDGFRAIGGMFLMIVGGGLMIVGARGAAGSGLKLDPEQARRDGEPWSRMAGGMAKDALDEAGIRLGGPNEVADLPFDEKLRRLHGLYKDGILTEAEYLREKQELLDRN